MRCSLFGKLGAKRDFVALATPRRFLETWEPWVQACMSASRHQLGAEWQNAFLTAPVWRFLAWCRYLRRDGRRRDHAIVWTASGAIIR